MPSAMNDINWEEVQAEHKAKLQEMDELGVVSPGILTEEQKLRIITHAVMRASFHDRHRAEHIAKEVWQRIKDVPGFLAEKVEF